MGSMLRAEMLFSVDVDGHPASTIAAFEHDQAERARKRKIFDIGLQWITVRADHRRAAAAADAGYRAVAGLGKRARNDRRNKDSRG